MKLTLTEVETLISAQTPANLALLQSEGRGPLTSNIGEAGGFVRTVDGLAGPDVQLHAAPVMFVDEGLALPAQHAYTFGAAALRPTKCFLGVHAAWLSSSLDVLAALFNASYHLVSQSKKRFCG